ncbi:MAG: serine/threonine-protein kinase PknF [Candidatus Hydrogenedentota bacterium]
MGNPLQPGTVLADRFHLVRPLGSGAVGMVWQAQDAHLENEEVAVKILNPSFTDDPQAISDLKREVLLTRRLRHPNIVAIHTFWDAGEHRFITMEYVKGGNLAGLLRERQAPFAAAEILPWAEQLCQALHHAHEQEVLHRDIKPGNILIDGRNRVRLADFGIARTAQEARDRISGHVTSGTILFMSPEQLLGMSLDQRSDLYSLAATIYELLRGHPPFYRGAILNQIQNQDPPPIPNCSDELNGVLLRALRKNPKKRQTDCLAFLSELAGTLVDGNIAAGDVPEKGTDSSISWGETSPQNETVLLSPPKVVTGRRIGDLLVEAGVITDEQLQMALQQQRKGQERLGMTLVRLGFADEELIANALSDQMAVPRASFETRSFDVALAKSIPRVFCESHKCLPICRIVGQVIVAMADPMDFATLNELEQLLEAAVEPRVATASGIMSAVERVFG